MPNSKTKPEREDFTVAMALRLGATAAAIASVAMFAGLASAQQAAAPAAPAATPTVAGPGGKQVPDLNGIWGGNLVAGGTNIVDSCKTVIDNFQREGGRFAYQGRTGSQQWVTFEQSPKGTRVHTWGDIVHSGVTIAGRRVEHLVTAFTEMWYENFRVACDQLAKGMAEAGD